MQNKYFRVHFQPIELSQLFQLVFITKLVHSCQIIIAVSCLAMSVVGQLLSPEKCICIESIGYLSSNLVSEILLYQVPLFK